MVLFLCITSIAWGQTGTNPFDLKYRTAKPKIQETPATIQRDSVKKPVQAEINPPTATPAVVVSPDTVPAAGIVIPADSVVPGQSSNPFETQKGGNETPTFEVDTLKTTIAKEVPAEKIIPKSLRKQTSRGFQIFFLLLSLLFLIFIVNVERSFVRDLWRVISNENYSSLHHRNQRNTMRQILLMMGYTVFVIQAGLFIYHSLRIYHYAGTVLDNIWVSILLVLGIYLIRHAVIRYLRWLFNNEKELTLYGFDISIFNTMVGLILLPINILLIFGPENIHKPLVIIGIIAIAGAYLMRQLRWLLTARQLIVNSLFLFFVYLCAVEILPLWAISKLFW